MDILAVRVQCGCGQWLRFDLEPEGRSKEKSCWRCSSAIKAVRIGGEAKGYRKPVMSASWIEASVDISQEAL